MRYLGYLGRFFVMWAVMTWFLLGYAVGRLGRVFIRDREARRRSVAHLRGRLLRRAMAALGATFVKLGQVLSTRPDLLDPELIDELRQLQDRMAAFPMPVVRRTVEAELGVRLEERFSEFDEKPVAAASVAQVHRARLKDGGAEVAVKVLRPDVRAKVERDAVILTLLARMIAWHPTWRLSDPVGHLRHFIAGILEQTDLRVERRHYELFRAHFAGKPGVRFPAVHAELSDERMLTMEFMRGTKIDALPPGDHRELAGRLQRIFLKMCFEDGFIHADLHPGNLLISDGGEIVIFDTGLAKQLGPDVLLQFLDFTKCVAVGTPADFISHMKRFHSYNTKVDWERLERDITKFLAHFRGQNIAELEIGALMNEVFALARRYRVRPVTDLALVMVGLVTAEGIAKQLHPQNNLFNDIGAYIMPLLAERGLSLEAAGST